VTVPTPNAWRILAGGLMLASTLIACQRTPEETRIRQAIDDMVVALEKGDSRRFLDHIADPYRDHEGRDRQGLCQLLLANFLHHRQIRLLVTGTSIERQGDRADVRLQARLTSGEQLAADRRFGVYRVRTLWRRDGGDWLIYEAEWEPLANS